MIRLLIFISVLASTFVVFPGQSFSQETKNIHQKEGKYVVLSAEKFAEIKAEMEKQDDWSPILIEGYPKNELVAFYIQSYDESTILTWVDFAYNKIQSLEKLKPDCASRKENAKIKTPS